MRKNLANERKKAKLTQVELANKIGIGERQYQKLEAGTSDSSMRTWKELKALLGKSIDYLLEQEQMEEEPDGNPAEKSITTKE